MASSPHRPEKPNDNLRDLSHPATALSTIEEAIAIDVTEFHPVRIGLFVAEGDSR